MAKAFDFKANVNKALADQQLRGNFAAAMGGFVLKRRALLSDPEETERLRAAVRAIRRRTLAKLPKLLQKLEENCTKNGIHVHWAETTDEANALVLSILRSHNATRLVKGKSMVSEEMHLNHFLEAHGIEVAETDLGEFIIQLAGEPPSHIIVPAVHKNRRQVGEIFHQHLPDTPLTEDIPELNAIARKTLRRKYMEADAGLSGVNFAVAETGTLCLVENEGNGRMCTTAPPLHIAVAGIEKVIEKLEDIHPVYRLLTASATGQLITTYFNMITSPRRKGERDGPDEIHLILLDNGRSDILADPELRQTLQCIRCGSCLNHCPVYTRIGGHAYGHVYPGPIGKILTPQMVGLDEAGKLTTASSLCNACEEVCPAMIPIPDLLRRLRSELNAPSGEGTVRGHGAGRSCTEAAVWKGWQLVNTTPKLNELATRMAGLLGDRLPAVGPLGAWMSARTRPKLARKSLHRRCREEGVDDV
ncbi:L-lactate dehydrogenase complex protein LldF [Desulfobaculum xiamenense]|uniref:L-lactate dehydrogenase complex protein LldF n=1 Tax=Desulfobaculum xiamenense TaxID=995050 RepID=A0A846QP95_9BACT|nr:LutB/LldF family L-lactate oxidation iron-sulfur protein [Desulfobaculum xiamenense]NJB68830.1 L-lactate dehydrogenase complex protein LldF [Desulfobaculum xiamenense]